MDEEKKIAEKVEEAKAKEKFEEVKIEAKIEESKIEAKVEEAKAKAKVEEAKLEAKVEEAKLEEKKIIGKKSHSKAYKKYGMIVAGVVLVLLLAGSYGWKTYRQKVDIGPDAIKAKVTSFLKDNVPPTSKAEIKDIAKEGILYKVTITVDKQDVSVYVTSDGAKLVQAQAMIDLDKKAGDDDAKQQAQAPEEQKEIPKTDKPSVDLYVMSFCPYGNKAEDTLKSAYDLLKNKVNFNFHYIVSTSGSDIQSLHGAKEVAQNEREACVLKNYGKDKWMGFVTYVNGKCGSDGACWEDGAKSLGMSTAKISSCVDSQGLALMQQNEKDSNAANASGSPTMTINGVTTNAVYQYDNAEAYKQAICSGFSTQPKECQTKLSEKAAAGSSTPSGSCTTPQQ